MKDNDDPLKGVLFVYNMRDRNRITVTRETQRTRNPDDFVQLPTRHQVWKDGKWVEACDCNVPRDQCEHPVCTHGIINAARDANS